MIKNEGWLCIRALHRKRHFYCSPAENVKPAETLPLGKSQGTRRYRQVHVMYVSTGMIVNPATACLLNKENAITFIWSSLQYNSFNRIQ